MRDGKHRIARSEPIWHGHSEVLHERGASGRGLRGVRSGEEDIADAFNGGVDAVARPGRSAADTAEETDRDRDILGAGDGVL